MHDGLSILTNLKKLQHRLEILETLTKLLHGSCNLYLPATAHTAWESPRTSSTTYTSKLKPWRHKESDGEQVWSEVSEKIAIRLTHEEIIYDQAATSYESEGSYKHPYFIETDLCTQLNWRHMGIPVLRQIRTLEL